jgi:hypothetical protein
VALAVGISLAASACGSAASQTTLRLESQLSSTKNVFVTPGQSLGQELIFSAMIYPPGAPAATGRSQGTCLRAEPGDGEVYNCQLTFVLAAGTIYALALSSHDGPASGVIAGGTGSYKNTRGSFLYVSTGKARISLTLTLTS